MLAQAQWLPVLRALGTRPWFGGRLMVSGAHQVFNENGELVDEAVRKQLRDFLRGFAQFVQASVAPHVQCFAFPIGNELTIQRL
ncbi:MAG: hypothetical protein JNJ50_27000 [Acidobacteria bacterium]|nr:hypothetical protein [Acidobacteriota bacterium]